MSRKVKTLLIGVGRHAKRIYLPYLKNGNSCKLAACLDLALNEKNVRETIKLSFGKSVFCYFTQETTASDKLKKNEADQLNKIVKDHEIEAIIIATEPLSHFKYIYWAIENSLHILLDKPITTEINAANSKRKALKIFEDYEKIINLYENKCKKKNIIFNLQAQRRYHRGYQKAREKIKEISKITNCPVNFIQAFHSDGQWTFPNEFVSQSYHPYNQGYGKMSHSGYHSMDISLWLALSSLKEEKYWDSYSVFSQFVRPKDVAAQFNEKDFKKLFPEMKKNNWDLKMKDIRDDMGEVDAHINLSLRKKNRIITSINCNALHHSFSGRGWYDSMGRDLYKGNGRIRQESYVIEQGPFQSIVINSFQSAEIRKGKIPLYNFGGEYHYDIHVFRNDKALKNVANYEKINLTDLQKVEDFGYSRGHQEDARRSCLSDFYCSIIKNKKPSEQVSNIIYHSLSTQIFSSIYLSAAENYNKSGCLINDKIKNFNKIYEK